MQSATPSGQTTSQEPTTGFAPASTGLQDRRLSQSSHVGKHTQKHEREESNPVRQFWRLAALPGAHSCEAHGSHRLQTPGLGHGLTVQRHVPVRLAQKLRPAFDPRFVPGVHRLPGRAGRLLAELEARLLRRAVGLPLVARHASQHAVFPGRGTGEGAGVEPARQRSIALDRLPTGFRHLSGCPSISPVTNTPTRTRTRNASLGPRCDVSFTIGAHRPSSRQRKARESNPHPPKWNRLSRAARPTVFGYLPFPHSVDRRGVEPRLPGCKPGVVPLDQQPA